MSVLTLLCVPAVASGALPLRAATAAAARPTPPRSATPAAIPAGAHVSIRDFTFQPAALTVTAGTAVTWTYDESATDPVPNCESPYLRTPALSCPGHSVTSYASDEFDSGIHRAEGFPFTHVFRTPGRYHYFCEIHGGPSPNNPVTHMDADIIVVPAGQG